MPIGPGSKLLAILFMLLLLAGCNEDGKGDSAQTEEVETPTVANSLEADLEMEYSTPHGPRELSIVDFKGLYNRVPTDLDIGRNGNYVFFKLLLEDGEHAVYSASLDGGKAAEPVEILRGDQYNLAFIAAHPSLNECLVTTNYMADDGHVHNRIWRAGPGLLEEVPYEQCPGLPGDHPADMLSSLRPFYSWDGEQVVVQTSRFGVAVLGRDGTPQAWLGLPDPKINVTGAQCSVLPDSDEGRQVCFSVWEAISRDEKCRMFTLDLDALDGFSLRFDLTWVIYRFSSPDLVYDPWTLRGSRLPDYLEDDRQPRVSLYDPESGMVKDVEFGGDPEFNTAMDSYGRYVGYMDSVRRALVRLEVASGELDINGDWFSEDANIFLVGDGAETYVWHRDILTHAFDPK